MKREKRPVVDIHAAMLAATQLMADINKEYDKKRNARILALKPDPDGRITYADLRKAARGLTDKKT